VRDDHGGNWRRLPRGASRPALLDLSESINPLGVSPRVASAIRDALPTVAHYPDPRASAVVEALASYHGVSTGRVIAGNGSTELLYLVARAVAPRRALIVHPAFSEYEAALTPLGCEIERVVTTAGQGWAPRLDEILARIDRVELVLLANPGNPSGALVPPHLLDELAPACEGRGTVLGVDEAFIDFTEERSFKAAVARFPRLVIFRSLTKFFALPGLRLGYALLGEIVRDRVEAWRQPWSVNVLAEAAGIAALGDRAYQAESRRLVPTFRAGLAAGLEKLGAFSVYPSAANYILARIERADLTASALRAALLSEGVAIRDCSSFPGLGQNHVRVAVARPDDQRVFFAALERSLGG